MDVYAPVRLTAREAGVLRLMAQGHTNADTATRMGTSVFNVKRDLQMIAARLGTQGTGVNIVVAAHALGLLSDIPRPLRTAPKPRSRHMDVLRLMAQGLTDQQIGNSLYLAETTIKTHIKDLYRVLKAKNRPHAVTLGLQFELI